MCYRLCVDYGIYLCCPQSNVNIPIKDTVYELRTVVFMIFSILFQLFSPVT